MRMLVIDFPLCFLLGVCSGVLSVTLSKSKICARLRERVAAFSFFGGQLISCPYCVGHWIALALVLLYQPCGFDPWLKSFWIALGLVIAVSSITSGIIIRLFGEPHAEE